MKLAAGLLLLAALAGVASANINDDRIAARTACYKACISRDGWDPICAENPAFPNVTTHGGGPSVWPNECTAQCMAQYCKYGEWCRLDTLYRVKLPSKCLKHAWDIFISLDKSAPECTDAAKLCVDANKATKPPKDDRLPESQCMKACMDRDGWQPLCVKDFNTGKKVAFGNACAAECTKLLPTPLYRIKLPSSCKKQFLKTGKMPKACGKCPKGKVDDNLFTDSDRVVARTACYKDCISRNGWAPICAENPAFPNVTTHGGGPSVWPNECTAQCMAQYCKYGEWCHLETKYKIELPKKCEKKMWDIYYIGAEAPSASESLIKKCTTCPPPTTK